VVYLLHLAIVRDLSTSRIGLAVVVYLLGQVQDRRPLKYALYLLAISFHLTVLVVMIGWGAACFVARQPSARRWLLGYSPLLLLVLTGTQLLNMGALVDPRVAIYLSWDEEGFGAPLASFAALARSAVVLALLVAAQRRFRDLNLRVYILMELLGAAILIGLSEFSVFSARLSNVAISMYPVGLGIVASAYQTASMRRRARNWGLLAKTSLVGMLVILLARPASVETLVRVVPSTFAAAQDAGR